MGNLIRATQNYNGGIKRERKIGKGRYREGGKEGNEVLFRGRNAKIPDHFRWETHVSKFLTNKNNVFLVQILLRHSATVLGGNGLTLDGIRAFL